MHPRHRRMSRRSTLAVAIAGLVVGISPVGSALAADPVEVIFNFTGSEQTWVVPGGVTSIDVELAGGSGGNASGASGGLGARFSATIAVDPGTTLYIEVGGNGASFPQDPTAPAGGFNGGGNGGGVVLKGGGGGGASDIRTVPRATAGSLDSRLIVAAGGGGAGAGVSGTGAGAGGAADSDGGRARNSDGVFGAEGKSGGDATAPGDGGGNGGDGAIGQGGAAHASSQTGGGGGGGGSFGGGAGGAGQGDGTVIPGGGGGGGSSDFGAATNIVEHPDGSTPRITISYGGTPDPSPATGAVDADVTVPESAACIELSETAVSFGTQRFGAEDVPATPGITVTNCSGGDATLLAHGTDANGNGATWNLVDNAATCGFGTLDTDEFHLDIRREAGTSDPITRLSTNNKQIAPLQGGAAADLDALLDMPCPGSSGAGQTMGMQIVFVVTEGE